MGPFQIRGGVKVPHDFLCQADKQVCHVFKLKKCSLFWAH